MPLVDGEVSIVMELLRVVLAEGSEVGVLPNEGKLEIPEV